MEDVFIRLDEGFFKNNIMKKDYVSIDDLISKIEDLYDDVERLQEELEDNERNLNDNYIKRPMSDYTGNADDDRY